MPTSSYPQPNRLPARTLLTAIAVAVLSGCETESKPPAPVEPPRPEAEVKFDHIYDDIDRIVGTEDSSAHDPGPAGGANTEWSHGVERKLVKPTSEDENYRGTITITRRYTVTMFTHNRDRDKEDEKSQDDRGRDAADSGDGSDNEFEIQFGQPMTDKAAPISSSSPIKTRDGEDVKDFELEYIDGSWRLLTKPDPETESAIQAAFEYALRRQ
ncbi:hypothetical protein Pla123a_38350 [Posidoniimonas polymericola]|uniref:Uncharacterized protein n=1 Tax=Posidoniimonas polymericola TaxID=2528002 RepID=A0A5C5YEX9_9BACT|nr:hypothetical protein [Posidoniimonas polymericola]TWT73499.1 hypothetical protein Pla123a_38350 [Posidoniimonas polymericola]